VRIKALLYTSHLFSCCFCCCGAKIGQKKNIAPNIGENQSPLYTLHFLSFFFFFFVVVVMVQKLAKRKTLRPILARIEKHIGPQIRTDPWD